MAKALYRQLFDWIVSNMNMTLAQKTNDGKLRETVNNLNLFVKLKINLKFFFRVDLLVY